MANWHYCIVKRKYVFPKDSQFAGQVDYYYQVHEYWPDMDSWTGDAVSPIGDTIEELESALKMMLSDVKKRRKIIDETNE